MPLPRKVIDNLNAKIESAPIPTDQEFNDLRSLAKSSWLSFQKAVKAGLITDVTYLLGSNNTYEARDTIKAHGGYFDEMTTHWYVRASEVDGLMAEVEGGLKIYR